MKAKQVFQVGLITPIYMAGFATGFLLVPAMAIAALVAPKQKIPEPSNVIRFRKRK